MTVYAKFLNWCNCLRNNNGTVPNSDQRFAGQLLVKKCEPMMTINGIKGNLSGKLALLTIRWT